MIKAKWIPLIVLVCLLTLPFGAAGALQRQTGGEEMRPVQVFDVEAGKVVKSVPNSEQYQGFAREWLGSVTGLAPQLSPGDKCGFVYRIPLTLPYTVRTGELTVRTSDVFLFYCPGKPKLLLIFDEERKPYLLQFKADIEPFVKTIGLP
ncbi:hypothetical protein [Paenibacillus humicola]|uniref:hypothetical protein n=1 Tax=Paenibacillus humicola TaxID=3110540 RepID=UPI00237AFEB5|nr:hypothetical protein [Paenibacillus humicola]